MNNETHTVVEEPIEKPSKLKKIGSIALAAGFYGTVVAAGAASTYYSFKTLQMTYETAKLNLAVAAEAAAQK
jgi:hypothetical protein